MCQYRWRCISWLTLAEGMGGGGFKNALYKNHIFQCMGKIFCVEFQRVPLKFHTKYLTHTLNDVDFIHR